MVSIFLFLLATFDLGARAFLLPPSLPLRPQPPSVSQTTRGKVLLANGEVGDSDIRTARRRKNIPTVTDSGMVPFQSRDYSDTSSSLAPTMPPMEQSDGRGDQALSGREGSGRNLSQESQGGQNLSRESQGGSLLPSSLMGSLLVMDAPKAGFIGGVVLGQYLGFGIMLAMVVGCAAMGGYYVGLNDGKKESDDARWR